MSLPPTPGRPSRPHSRSRLHRPPEPHKLWGREPRCLVAPPGCVGLPHGHLYDPRRPESSFKQCFECMGLLGRGSYGMVYKVRSLADGRLYAVKRSRRPFRGPADRERSLLEAFRHHAAAPELHCVRLWAAWEERGLLYLQSQLCRHGSLRAATAGRRRGERRALRGWRLSAYMSDLLAALRHLHGSAEPHGDVQPGNALLHGGRCLLADFGCGLEGAGRYAAPELGGGGATAEGDVFSLALTVAEVALGERAADGETWAQLRGGRLPRALREVVPAGSQRPVGRPLLADWGRYAAPELGGGGATAEGDVFSLALTVAEVALGERAADGETWAQLRGGRLPRALREAVPAPLLPLLAAMLDPDPRLRPTAAALLDSAPMRSAARWRPISRLLDLALRRGAELLQSCRSALWALWAALWGRAMGRRSPLTPPHTPVPPHIDPWDEDEEEEEIEAPWDRSPNGSPTAFGPIASTPQHRRSAPSSPDGSPASPGRLRRTLTFEEDPEPRPIALIGQRDGNDASDWPTGRD